MTFRTSSTLVAVLLAASVGCTKDTPAPAKPASPPAASAKAAGGEPATVSADQPGGRWMKRAAEGQDIYAVMKTSLGDITLKLYAKEAPKTVSNFVGLASGEKDWVDPKTNTVKKGTPLYAGTIFHRVIDGFMIQGGDPTGTGRGSPGYRFGDEFQSGKTFDKVGLLAMANAGPGTNGSQFFITVSLPSYLNNRHTIFGEVVRGYETVEKIAKTPKGPGDKPTQDVTITQIDLMETAP